MSIARHHNEWLSLIEVSGPFLTLPVLQEVFPQGLPNVDSNIVARTRHAYEEWAEARRSIPQDLADVHGAWIRLVLEEILEFDNESLVAGERIPKDVRVSIPEHHEQLVPDYMVVNPSGTTEPGRGRLLIQVWSPEQNLEGAVESKDWTASPAERMTLLCRETGVRLGLVTNGSQWMLVDAPQGETAGFASWYAELWLAERLTLRAFQSLLGVYRFFNAQEGQTLEQMLTDSVAYQQDVTDRLGDQVRRAVEGLVQALDRADSERQRELLEGLSAARIYDGALTVMMRLVFLFCAEERGLLLLGDTTYNSYYAVSTLRSLLRDEADRVGLAVLERRYDAWARLLASFRAVYAGIDHEALRMPALGGTLFDPDRYPFLEGRQRDTSWRETPAIPLPIDNRTVLHLLESLQLLGIKGDTGAREARKLSFRSLDVEQIGHVYEGLLDHHAVRVDGPTIGLVGTKNKEPEIELDTLEAKRSEGDDVLLDFLHDETGSSTSALRRKLANDLDENRREQLLIACGAEEELLKRIVPFHGLVRDDVWGYPLVWREGAFMVTTGTDRRQTGTHYTPKFLTEAIVTETLEPLVYEGPAEGEPREAWKLRPPAELLELKICDMAMGSAAFLVQACRWLSERLVEGWEASESGGKAISREGEVLEILGDRERLPEDTDERLTIARRLIAERCLYGLDMNPMAVELAKLSLWLVTMAKGRPFGFLDHNLRCGDSLLGVHDLDQLRYFHPDPERGAEIHHGLFDPAKHIESALAEAEGLRRRIRSMPIRDIDDVRAMARLHKDAQRVLRKVQQIADLVTGAAVATAGEPRTALDEEVQRLAVPLGDYLQGRADSEAELEDRARELLDKDCPDAMKPRRTFNWPVEYPEVFSPERGGFDAIVGNPPFLGGKRITGALSKVYRQCLIEHLAFGAQGSADLVAYFFLRALRLARDEGNVGLLAVNSIAEGDTRQVGLEQILSRGAVIYSAHPNEPWPGEASIVTSRIQIHKGNWKGNKHLLGQPVSHISAFLSDQEEWSPKPLAENSGYSFIGSYILGQGFGVSDDHAKDLIEKDPKNRDVLYPYLNGEDVNSDPWQRPGRWVVNFWDWPLARDADGKWQGADNKKRKSWLRDGHVPPDYPGRVAEDFPDVIHIVRSKVKPERQRQKENGDYVLRKPLPQRWWQYADKRPALYHAIGYGGEFAQHPKRWIEGTKAMERVLVYARVSKHWCPVFSPNGRVFTDSLGVNAVDSGWEFAVLQSSIHTVWAWKQASRLELRLRYTPSDIYDTFPHPRIVDKGVLSRLDKLGEKYHVLRQEIMAREGAGLTRFYNMFHDPEKTDRDLEEMRRFHGEIDSIVATAYGWTDLELNHDFHAVAYLPENDRLRYTVSEETRIEIIHRLNFLNRERYKQEVGQRSKRDKKKSRTKSASKTSRQYATNFESVGSQGSLAFNHSDEQVDVWPRAAEEADNDVSKAIIEWLGSRDGWYSRSEIVKGSGVSVYEWKGAIKTLLGTGTVKRKGKRRGTKYAATLSKQKWIERDQ